MAVLKFYLDVYYHENKYPDPNFHIKSLTFNMKFRIFLIFFLISNFLIIVSILEARKN